MTLSQKPHPFLAVACDSPDDATERAQRELRDMHTIRAYNHGDGRALCFGTGIIITETPKNPEPDDTRLPKMQGLLDMFATAAGAAIADLSNGGPDPNAKTAEEQLRAAKSAAAIGCIQVVNEYLTLTRAQKNGTDGEAPAAEAPRIIVPEAPEGIVPAHDGKIILPE